MSKPFALLSFDPMEWDLKSLSFEVDVVDGVVNWVLLFGNAFFIEKTIPGRYIAASIAKLGKGRSFVLVEFDADDMEGMLPASVAKEIRAALRKPLPAATC